MLLLINYWINFLDRYNIISIWGFRDLGNFMTNLFISFLQNLLWYKHETLRDIRRKSVDISKALILKGAEDHSTTKIGIDFLGGKWTHFLKYPRMCKYLVRKWIAKVVYIYTAFYLISRKPCISSKRFKARNLTFVITVNMHPCFRFDYIFFSFQVFRIAKIYKRQESLERGKEKW